MNTMGKLESLILEDLKETDLVGEEGLIHAFEEYLKRELGYDDLEAALAAVDMDEPYNVPYVLQEYIDTVEIGGHTYEGRYCHTDFCRCGLFHLADVTPFEFYMLFDTDTMEDQTVGSYDQAKKKFVV